MAIETQAGITEELVRKIVREEIERAFKKDPAAGARASSPRKAPWTGPTRR